MTEKNYDIVKLNIDVLQMHELAEEIFLKISGINSNGKKFERMKADAFKMRELIKDGINIIAECRFYPGAVIEKQNLAAGNMSFICNAFEQIEPDSVNGVYVYVISAGDFYIEDEKVINQLYADFWGNAYTDALRMMVKEELEKKARLSDSFGPGFYGMGTVEIVKFAELMDFEELGITVHNGTTMVPLKSCTGMYFSINDRYRRMDAACADCAGSFKSCRLCLLHEEEKK